MKRKISFAIMLLCIIASLTACKRIQLEDTTVYYSMISSPEKYFIRLEADGDYIDGSGMLGKYELDGEKISFRESQGGLFSGYLVNDDKYIFANPFNGYEDKIPDQDKFELICFDGSRTTVNFYEDGKMEKYVYEENYMDYHFGGTYERKGNLIITKFNSSEGGIYTQTYGVYDGVLYEAYSSDLADFTDKQVASMADLKFEDDGEPVNVLAVVMIAFLLLVIFVVIFVLLYVIGKNNGNNKNKKANTKKK